MTDADSSTKPPDLPPMDIDVDATAQVLRRISAALRDATPSEVPDPGVVERLLRRAAAGATHRLDAMVALLEAGALVEVGLVARLLFELEVSVGYILVPEDHAERIERAERFEAWDSYTMAKMIVGTAEMFPFAGLAELYPRFAGVLREEIRDGARGEMEALVKRFPGLLGARTWSGMTLKDMGQAVAKSGRRSAYVLLYPMLSLFSHASNWSVARPATPEENYLSMLLLGLFPLQSALAAYAIWRQASPEVTSPPLRAEFNAMWNPGTE